ncbi:tyrosine-type recombinase/integrase [Pseudomonas viridiflava]|uniref:tyrosine-type recombinase/integrase n=1 Tax=Pseudomonas viridiflava TaxID=33069 RepID=UPI000F01CB8C|nr:tyrosine-type recombinase/integrase [Pseudomonas viridiflava]
MSTFEFNDDDLIADFELDADEAIDAALADLLTESASAAGANVQKDSLVAKLSLYPDGNFPVSDHSYYNQSEWLLHNPQHGFPAKVKLDREVVGANELKRALCYYLIPDFAPQGNIRSFTTTKARAYEFSCVEDFIFRPNHLTAEPEDIRLITAPMLNRALNAAKSGESKRRFVSLFFFIRLWGSLSTQKLIPEELCLNVDLRNVDTLERHKEVRQVFNGVIQSWVPYSETELEHLINYALFWTEEAVPHLLAAKSYIQINKFDQIAGWSINRVEEQPGFDKYFDIELKGNRVLSYSRTMRKATGQPDKLRNNYTWIQHYATALDKVRNGLFILVALITGARKSELALIKLADVWCDEAGRYWVNITRFKTAQDPAYNGEKDVLPLPEFLGKKIDDYKDLKNIGPFVNQPYLFQANYSVKVLNKATPALINQVVNQLKEQLPIDRIHAHRFRKTIAEILINRDERNIELIRMLFGHKSYAMTLRYIGRNPYLVRGVAQALEESFAHEFHEIVKGVRDGSYSGGAAERIAVQITARPKEFTGQRLRLSIMLYISHLLLEGESVYIGRTALGTFCITGEHFTRDTPPPCLAGRPHIEDFPMPDTTNCQIDCRNAVVLQKAKRAIEENITFYTSVLLGNTGNISRKAEMDLRRKIGAHEMHLVNLENNKHKALALEHTATQLVSQPLTLIEAHEVA